MAKRATPIDKLIAKAKEPKEEKLSGKQTAAHEQQVRLLSEEIVRLRKAVKTVRPLKPIKVLKGKAARHELTFVIPDSHGEHIHIPARDAFLRDLARAKPERIVMVGDHLDAGGTFNAHQKTYTKELCESYDADVQAANEFLDLIQAAAPCARIQYLFGNHESHIARFCARTFTSYRDAEAILARIGPAAVLRLGERGIQHYLSEECYEGISIPGTIRHGKLFYTHGIACGKHATSTHLERFAGSVIHGHTHRAQSYVGRTVTSDALGAWCFGTLAKLQPLYAHTAPTNWSWGYGIVTTNISSGRFSVQSVPIHDGESLLISDFKRAA